MILHQHFKIPQHGGAIRSYYLAKALVEKGLDAIVITAHNEPGYIKKRIEGIEVHYLPVLYDNHFGFYKRVYAFVQFTFKAVKFASRYKDADLCYAISVPLTTGVAAAWIRQKYKIPFIFEVGDLWPDAPVQMGFVRNWLLRWGLYKVESVVYSRARSIVALSPAIREIIHKKAPGKIIHLLPNMADTDFFRAEEKHPVLEDKFNVRGKFVVSYLGAIGVANGLDYFLECAKASQQSGLGVHFLICGEGAMLDNLEQSAQEMLLQNLTFIPFRNRDGVAEVMNVTDAAFTCYKPVIILETGSPNKYFDGLAAGKLTIINFGGWIRKEIEREACGIYVDPQNPEDFVQKIKPFLDNNDLLERYQQAGRLLAEKKYSRKILGEKFCALIEDAGQSRNP